MKKYSRSESDPPGFKSVGRVRECGMIYQRPPPPSISDPIESHFQLHPAQPAFLTLNRITRISYGDGNQGKNEIQTQEDRASCTCAWQVDTFKGQNGQAGFQKRLQTGL
jgi:hypothetical protein